MDLLIEVDTQALVQEKVWPDLGPVALRSCDPAGAARSGVTAV
jgi:hypothetical protein